LDYDPFMYLEFFNLQNLPFRLTADPRFHYETAERADAKRHMLAALLEDASPEGDGCVLVSGDAGVGKTILVHDVLSHLDSRFVVIRIGQPEISVSELHDAVIWELERDAPASYGTGRNTDLDAHLTIQTALGRTVVLAMDNGEALAEDVLDELLRMPQRSRATRRGLRVILAGRTSMLATLRKPRYADPQKQPGLRINLVPFTADETRGYVDHRLRIAGHPGGGTFAEDTVLEMQRFTGGVPRLINTLADAALMAAFNRNHKVVTAFEIRGGAKELQWVEFDARADRAEIPSSAIEELLTGHIRIEHQNTVAAEFDLPLGKITLGRSANNDVCIESRYVSRNHCRIVTTAQYSVIEDLQSQNGLMVASRRVSVHRLHHGDRIQMGEHYLIYTREPLPGLPKTDVFPLSVSAGSKASDTGQTGLILSVPAVIEGAGPREEGVPKEGDVPKEEDVGSGPSGG
jgi:general secretion pathway protein A